MRYLTKHLEVLKRRFSHNHHHHQKTEVEKKKVYSLLFFFLKPVLDLKWDGINLKAKWNLNLKRKKPLKRPTWNKSIIWAISSNAVTIPPTILHACIFHAIHHTIQFVFIHLSHKRKAKILLSAWNTFKYFGHCEAGLKTGYSNF